MALVTRKVEETISVVQDARNGQHLTLYDLAEFAMSCSEVGIEGDAGVQVRCESNGSATQLATAHTFDRSEAQDPEPAATEEFTR